MVSVSTVKTYLRITDTTSDALIATLIPVVYAEIIQECNNLFASSDFTIADDTIYFDHGTDDTINLTAGGFADVGFPTTADIIVTGSRLNDGIYTIGSQSDTVLTVDQTVLDETQTTAGYEVRVSMALFPRPMELIASRMIGYQIANAASAGVQSMSLGNYSETRKTLSGGYPDEILNQLRPWKNMTTGRGTVRWHINENRVWFPPWSPNVAGGMYGD